MHKLIKNEIFSELMRRLENVSEVHFDKLEKKFVYKTFDKGPDGYIDLSLPLLNSYKVKILKLKQSHIID